MRLRTSRMSMCATYASAACRMTRKLRLCSPASHEFSIPFPRKINYGTPLRSRCCSPTILSPCTACSTTPLTEIGTLRTWDLPQPGYQHGLSAYNLLLLLLLAIQLPSSSSDLRVVQKFSIPLVFFFFLTSNVRIFVLFTILCHRELALATNLGQLLEAKGKQLLGSQYQDPLSGFTSLQSLSVNQPEVALQLSVLANCNLFLHVAAILLLLLPPCLQSYQLTVPVQVYWKVVLDALHVPFQQQPECILEVKKASTSPGGTWLPGATLNAAAWCLRSSIRSNGRDVAVAWRDEGSDDLLNYLRLDELRAKVW